MPSLQREARAARALFLQSLRLFHTNRKTEGVHTVKKDPFTILTLLKKLFK